MGCEYAARAVPVKRSTLHVALRACRLAGMSVHPWSSREQHPRTLSHHDERSARSHGRRLAMSTNLRIIDAFDDATAFRPVGIRGAILLGMAILILAPAAWGQETHQRAERSPVVRESVTVSTRCEEGTLVSGSHRVSAADVRIVEQSAVDCDAEGCRAWMVTALRENGEPFDLEVSVVCNGDGLDTVYDRYLEDQQQEGDE
jgi:hypothetical protein